MNRAVHKGGGGGGGGGGRKGHPPSHSHPLTFLNLLNPLPYLFFPYPKFAWQNFCIQPLFIETHHPRPPNFPLKVSCSCDIWEVRTCLMWSVLEFCIYLITTGSVERGIVHIGWYICQLDKKLISSLFPFPYRLSNQSCQSDQLVCMYSCRPSLIWIAWDQHPFR